MTARVWSALLLLCLAQCAARAHDLGVGQAALTELPDHAYRLSVRTGPALAALFGTPRLPERCEFTDDPGGLHAGDGLAWEFRCLDGPLRGDQSLWLPWRREGVMLGADWRDGSHGEDFFVRQGAGVRVPLARLEAGSGSAFDAAGRYLSLGVEHIALGIDHLLFVLCLLWVVRGAWTLVGTITAFTLAHSITLGLATLGLVAFSPAPVEASIALSIVFLAAEILRHRRGGDDLTLAYRAPWLVAFGFGLLHGLGFAGALADLGLPHREIPIALLFFNLGVELGQLVFVGLILLLGLLLRGVGARPRELLTRTAAYAIGGLATFWFLQRGARIVAGVV